MMTDPQKAKRWWNQIYKEKDSAKWKKGEIFKMHKDTTLRKKIEKKNLMLKRRNKTIEIKAETNYTKQVTGKKSTI